MIIKEVQLNEIERVMDIINDAKELLKKDSLQWQQSYPNINTMKGDIQSHQLFGAYIDDLLVGIVALVVGEDISYKKIYDGSWIIPARSSDLVIHRIAVKKEYHHYGVGKQLMTFADKYASSHGCKSIKADTHCKNKIMQYLLENNGYSKQGIIYLERDEVDNERIAYEKVAF